MFGAQDQQYALLHRHDVSRARAVLKDGHVTEELPGVLSIQGLCGRAKVFHDIHLARNDQVQFLAVIPFVNNRLTGKHLVFRHMRCDGTQLVQRHAAIERDTFQEQHDVRQR